MTITRDQLAQYEALAGTIRLSGPERAVRALVAEVRRLQYLIDYAMLLHECGETPPGHELATWGGWYRSVREGDPMDDDAARGAS